MKEFFNDVLLHRNIKNEEINFKYLKIAIKGDLKMEGKEFSEDKVIGPDGKYVYFVDPTDRVKKPMTELDQTVGYMMDIVDSN